MGEPASKANSRIVRVFQGKVLNIKSMKAQGYKRSFLQQCPTLPVLMEGDLRATITIWYASRRPDLDESLILDLMQERIYTNDRQIKERHVYWRLDANNPRADIRIEKIDDAERPDAGHSGRRKRKSSREG
jgi:Holliday junction resolvase RusA-like endonuclease